MNEEEKEVVRKAGKVVEECKIWLEDLYDFNIKEIERRIEKKVIKKNVE
ncbi:hypothetical protein [Bacillus subtilis]|nr:hypothetical protein [Bacillus subtilis]